MQILHFEGVGILSILETAGLAADLSGTELDVPFREEERDCYGKSDCIL